MSPARARLPRALRRAVEELADALAAGAASTLLRGSGIEADGVHPWQEGDDARRMDWAVTARRGSPHVRDYSAERELPTYVVVDVSASLGADGHATAWTVAGALALAQLRAGHPVGALRFGDGRPRAHLPVRTEAGLGELLGWLEPARSGGGETDLAGALSVTERLLQERSLVVLITDFRVGAPSAWAPPLHRLARRHALIPVWIEPRSMSTLPDVGTVEVEDPETGRHLVLDTSDPSFRSAVDDRERRRREEVESTLGRIGLRAAVVPVGGDPAAILEEFVRRRRVRVA